MGAIITSVLVIVIAIAGYVYFNYQDKKREIHKDRTQQKGLFEIHFDYIIKSRAAFTSGAGLYYGNILMQSRCFFGTARIFGDLTPFGKTN